MSFIRRNFIRNVLLGTGFNSAGFTSRPVVLQNGAVDERHKWMNKVGAQPFQFG